MFTWSSSANGTVRIARGHDGDDRLGTTVTVELPRREAGPKLPPGADERSAT